MKKVPLRLDRRWKILLFVTLGALFIYLVFPLLVLGMDSLLRFILWGTLILSSLPQILWWGAGVTVLVLWGLQVLINLGTNKPWEFQETKGEPENEFYHGRFWVIYQKLIGASFGKYSQEEVRNILRSLAMDWISLNLDISEEEAREKFLQGNWTEDRALQAYLFAKPAWEKEKQGFWRRFRTKKNLEFLEETEKALDRLKSYGNS